MSHSVGLLTQASEPTTGGLIRSSGSTRDRLGRTALHVAAARADYDLVEILLNEGASVSTLDERGNTPLHYCGHVETVQLLVNAGANLHLKNHHGDRALDLMRRKGVDLAVIQLTESLMNCQTSEFGCGMDIEKKPLLPVRLSKISLLSHEESPHYLLHEFCTDLGAKRLSVIIIIILCLSFYTAFVITGLSHGMVEAEIPIDNNMKDGVHMVEL